MENKTPRCIAYVILHYGAEYLREALLSVKDHVEKVVVLYTPSGSQGHATDIPPIESRDELQKICHDTLGEQLIWVDGTWTHEAHHREAVYGYTQGYDVLINVDADEIYNQTDISVAIQEVFEGTARYRTVNGFRNLWKSFYHEAVDFFRPVRFVNLNADNTIQQEIMCRIYHFSCAQDIKTIEYKWNISGHKDELRPDWFDIYKNWSTENRIKWLHPVSVTVWEEAIPFNPQEMPLFMREHKNYSKEVI